MRKLSLAALALCLGIAGGCGKSGSEPDEKQLHDMLSKPPNVHNMHFGGVGQKKFQNGGAAAPPAPPSNAP